MMQAGKLGWNDVLNGVTGTGLVNPVGRGVQTDAGKLGKQPPFTYNYFPNGFDNSPNAILDPSTLGSNHIGPMPVTTTNGVEYVPSFGGPQFLYGDQTANGSQAVTGRDIFGGYELGGMTLSTNVPKEKKPIVPADVQKVARDGVIGAVVIRALSLFGF